MPETTCPSQHVLTDFLLGKLDERQAFDVIAHLDRCVDCESTIENMDHVSDTVVAKLRRPPANDRYLDEPAYQRLVAVVDSIVSDASIGGTSQPGPDFVAPGDSDLLDEYRLLEKLGEGGMGAVYRALHTKLDRIVALKVLSRDRMRNQAAVARFEREMKAIGKLDHPNIVAALDASEADGVHYLVMEFVDGLDLKRLVQRRGPLAVADACELVRQAAVGLAHANQYGMVHRDIKPSNLMLMLGRTGSSSSHEDLERRPAALVKVLDLGLALLQEQHVDDAEGDLTSLGQMMGTLDYMAPEQGTNSHEVDIRADIYSLGATLYKLLTGRAPLAGIPYRLPVTKLMAIVSEPVPPLREARDEVPEPLAEIVHRMLAKTPEERFATPADVAAALAPFAGDHRIQELLTAPVSEPATIQRRGTDALTSASAPTRLAPGGTSPDAAATPPSKQAAAAVDRLGLSPVRSPERSGSQSAQSVTPVSGPVRRPFQGVALAAFLGVLLLTVVLALSTGGDTWWTYHLGRTPVPEDAGPLQGEVATLPAEAARVLPDLPEDQPVQDQLVQNHGETPAEDPAADTPSMEPTDTDSTAAAPAGEPSQDTGDLQLLKSFPLQASGDHTLQFSPDGRLLAVLSSVGGEVRMINTALQEEVESAQLSRKQVTALRFSPDGRSIATIGNEPHVRLWDARGLEPLRVLTHKSDKLHWVQWASFSPDGGTLAAAGQDGAVRLWNTRSGAFLADLTDAAGIPHCVKFSPDGRTLATSWATPNSTSGQIVLWDVNSAEKKAQLPDNTHDLDSFFFVPDAAALVTTPKRRDGLTLWDAHDGTKIVGIRRRVGDVSVMACSPRGDLIAVSGQNGLIALVDPFTGREQGPMLDHNQPVQQLEFTGQGDSLVSAGTDSTVTIWNVETRLGSSAHTGHTDGLTSFAVSGDGGLLASVGEDRMLKLWKIGTDTPIE